MGSQNNPSINLQQVLKQDEIVISGISGRFPKSADLKEFWQNLLNGVDMITEDDRRWTPGLNGLPTRSGKIDTLHKFDASFFGVHPKQANSMDPQLRMLLEVTHEAINDAGVNPVTIRGSRTGVFVGVSSNEAEKIWIRNSETTHGYAVTGCQRAMFSNRISFSFDFHGPSFTIDTACSSSFIALEQAIASIRLGHCDAAIVAGSNIALEPNASLQFHRLSLLSPDGMCKSFDAHANGYVRSEAVGAIFIQKKHVALRSYASILAACTNSDGHKEKGVTFPSGQRQAQLLEETYREAGVDPKDVVYVEAHGTGTQAGDPQELNAIADVFCKTRGNERPLLIGSVKSNAGHAEAASGILSMTKVLLSMQHGILPANLHYKTPNSNIPALFDGRLKVIAENTPWGGGIVGLNSFGFGGANVHVILKSNHEKNLQTTKTQMHRVPFLIPFSGRTKDAVEFALKKITDEFSKSAVLPQQLQRQRLLYEIARSETSGHTVRGHIVISSDIQQSHPDIQEKTDAGSPVWFIFNGMGSQWSQMGRHLSKFPVFENSVKDLAAILKPHGIDLMSILIDDDERVLSESVVKSFVAITSIQVALDDLLRSVDVTPSGGIIGHSAGEVAASYADGCFTAGQTVLAALARGKAITESMDVNEEGAMAAVGLTWEEAKQKCPPGIYPACHNAKDSVTVSGPKKDIEIFVQNLKTEGIFAKEVNSSKMAFHSKYIEPAKAKLKSLMDEIIPVPQPRSARWISSSVPENEWNSPLAQLSSADYHVNNVLSPVLFQECLQKIPDGSIVIEIGPHALLQAILKRSLPKCTNVGLVNKNHPDNSAFLLQALGKLYNSGVNLNLSTFYPPVEFPVAVDTPSISPLIKWDHSLTWDVPRFPDDDSLNSNSGEIVMEISLNEESQEFYKGHKIDGRIIFPGTGYLFLVWKAFASLQKKDFEQVPVVIENVNFLRATVLPLDRAAVKFHINILKGTGEFEIQERDVVKVTGIVRSPNGNEFLPLEPPLDLHLNPSRIPLLTRDVYKEIRLRGYELSGVFQGIHVLDTESSRAKLKWQNNWVTFIDTFLQMTLLHRDTRALYLPTHLDKAIFDPVIFLQSLQQQLDEEQEIEKEGIVSIDKEQEAEEETTLVPVFFYPDLNVVTCEGIQLQRLKVGTVSKGSNTSHLLRLDKFEFTSYFDDSISSESLTDCFETSLSVCLDIVLENTLENTLKMLEILGNGSDSAEKFVISQLAKTHILNQPTKSCAGKVIVLAQGQSQGQRSKVIEAMQNAVIQVTLATMENEAELVRKMSSSVDLVITDETQLLMNLNGPGFSLRDQGFLLYHKQGSMEFKSESESDFKALEDSCGLFLVAHKISPSRHFYLFKKSLHNFHDQDESNSSIHTVEINLSPDIPPYSFSHFNYSWVEELKMAMQKAADMKKESHFRIYLVSRENQRKSGQTVPSGVLGLISSLRKEPGGDKIRCFFIRDSPEFSSDLDFLKPSKKLLVTLQRDLVMNVWETNIWGSMRFYRLPEEVKMTTVEHANLNVMTRGDLSSLRWFESDLKYHEPQSEICSVYYAPLNFRDVMLCTGKLALDSLPNNLGSKNCFLGVEWSGTAEDGERVMGINPQSACALATSVVPEKPLLWSVPRNWTLAQAATVPMAYATAFYSLVVRGKIQKGESILIHAGAGGTGMAAIRVALSMHCTVYTTVGSQEKSEFLKKTFPELKDSSFANSRDSSFLEHILRETKGRGVDLVLNSLSGDLLQASIKCLAFQGRFLEIGKVDLFKNSSLGMSILLKNVCVHGILLDWLKDDDPGKLQTRQLLQEGLNSGVVQPLNATIFSDSVEDVEKAFRFMASGKHIGKVVIQVRNENKEAPKNSADFSKIVQALPRTHFDPRKCYIIIGGLGGFGLELCGWLIERGAKKLALVSRSGVRNGYQYYCLNKWRKDGATILTFTTDITTLEGVTRLFNESMLKLRAPLGGIFNLAMVLADGILQNQTAETFQAVSRPKINSTIFLDQASRTLAPSLEYFVVFSSVVSGRGEAGLSNYAWANSGMERICENRQKDGLSGTAIMWGAIGDVGVLQDEKGMGNEAEVGGTVPQRISSGLNSLEVLLLHSKFHRQPVLSSLVLAEKRTGNLKKARENGIENNDNLLDKIRHILGMKPEAMSKVGPGMKLHEMGMDSLMSVEIKQVVEMTTGATISSADMSELTFDKIHQLQSQMAHEDTQPNDPHISPLVEETETEMEKYEQNEDEVHQDSSAFVHLSGNPTSLSDATNMLQTETEIEQQDSEIKNTAISAVTSSMSHELISSDLNLSASMALMTSLTSAFSYCQCVCTFVLIGFLLLLSTLLRFGAKIYIKLFHDPKDLRLISGSFDNICAASPRTANMIFNCRVFGVPSKSKIIKMVNERVIRWKTNISFNPKLVEEYEPYESLRWRIKKGLFFYYWKRDRYFNVADHVVFEKCENVAALENATRRANEFYHNFKWTSEQRRPKPQWEFRVISPHYPVNFPEAEKEFVIMFCMHHGYGDAASCLHIVQYALADVKPPAAVTTQLKKSAAIPESTYLLRNLKNLVADTNYVFSVGNVLIKDLSRRRRETSENTPLCPVPGSKRHCGLAKYSVSQMKSVVTRDGAPVPLNSVILTCTSKVYQRLYASQKNPKKPKVPKSLMAWMPFSTRPYTKLGLVNNFTHAYTCIPLSTNTDDDKDDKTEEMSRIIQRNLVESSTPAILDASWINNWIMSRIPPPLDQLANAMVPSPHIVYTNVPATLSRHTTYFGGYKIKEVFGFTMFFRQTHASLATVVDSAVDTVSLNLVVDDSAMDICPVFVQRFFTLFQEELNHLADRNR